MERGPMALFGAIVLVGLGPALWLGAQFGDGAGAATKPPAVTSEVKANQDQGGVAGAAPEDQPVVVDTRQRGDMVPLSGTPTATPSASATPTKPADTDDAAVDPADPTTEPTPADETTAPTTEPTTDPATPPADDDPELPPVPPGGSDEDPTGGGQGAGETGTTPAG